MESINDMQAFLKDRLGDYLDLHRKMVEINSFTTNPTGVNAL
jgi:hypothetical protein